MSKCQVRESLEQVYAALFKDAAQAYPTLRVEFDKDQTRLSRAVAHRGLQVYLVDLPAVGKHLDRCLAGGQYKLSGLPLTRRVSGTVVIPKFLRGLYLLVFDSSGRLKEDCDIQAVFFLRQLLYAAKKLQYECSDHVTRATVREFVATDIELPEPERFWDSSSALNEGELPYHGFGKSELLRERVLAMVAPAGVNQMLHFLNVLDTVSGTLISFLGPYRPDEWRFRHGPGAIAEAVGPTNKYCWQNWSTALESEYPIADFGYHSLCSWAGSQCDESIDGDPYGISSRLVAVPKSYSGPRLIAAEPAAHQWCQQNVWHFLRTRTSATGIGLFVCFTDQSRNQRLCKEGSRTGASATIDLSAASDRVSCHVVGQLFRSNLGLLRSLRASRTHSVSQRLAHEVPGLVRLRKFTTMGSACTFPVESLIFLSVALASVLVQRGRSPSWANIRDLHEEVTVFGDDIIVPIDSRELFVTALEVLYFKVNTNKSFWTGLFRESCGVDSFRGTDVTPVYWRRVNDGKPEALASTVGCSNNFYNKFLLNTAAYLASTLPRGIPMATMNSGVVGLKSRSGVRNDGFRTRQNRALQRAETRVLSLQAKQCKSPTNNDTALLQYFTESPEPDIFWSHGYARRPVLRKEFRWVPTSDLSDNAQGL